MRVTKKQIVDGLASYILGELAPKMGREKGMQVALTVAVKTVQGNDMLIDKVFGSPLLQAVLSPDESGLYYEIGQLLDELEAATKKSGELPLTLPAIPLLAPDGGTITLYPEDIAAIRERIGGAGNV